MTLPEETPLPEENNNPDEEFSEVEFPTLPDLPEDFTPLIRPEDLSSPSRARRRRARRALVIPKADERARLLSELARRTTPAYDFFLFAIFSGLLLGAGYLLDSHAMLLLGLLLAPLLTPWVGLSLSALTGGWRFFLQMLASLLVAAFFVFFPALLLGLLGRPLLPRPFFNADIHAHLWWPDLLLVVAGAVLLSLSFVRGESRPLLPSILLAYGFFLPVAAAGFGLGIGAGNLWPDGFLVFLTYLALATLAGMITLASLRFRPLTPTGYLLPVSLGIVCVAILVTFTGLAAWIAERAAMDNAFSAPTPVALASPTPGLPPSPTPGAPTRTFTPLPSQTPSPTPTVTPTPVYAVINASTGGGAYVREEPGTGKIIDTLYNGTLVQVLPEVQMVGTIPWARIRTDDGSEGWVLKNLLLVATPAPTKAQIPTFTVTP